MSPREFKPGDRVEYVNRDWSPLLGMLGTVDDRKIMPDRVPVTWDDNADVGQSGEPPEHLRLINPAPVEPTDEQRAAWQRIEQGMGELIPEADPDDWRLIVALLPDSLTNPQPAMPTEPGSYEQEDGAVVILSDAGNWWRAGNKVSPELPLHRLVRERPQVTREQALAAVVNVTHGRSYSRVRETTPVQEGMLADAILALLNGTPDE